MAMKSPTLENHFQGTVQETAQESNAILPPHELLRIQLLGEAEKFWIPLDFATSVIDNKMEKPRQLYTEILNTSIQAGDKLGWLRATIDTGLLLAQVQEGRQQMDAQLAEIANRYKSDIWAIISEAAEGPMWEEEVVIS